MLDQTAPPPALPSGVILQRKRYLPIATYVTIALCGVAYLLMTLAGGSKNTQVLLEFGASFGPYIRQGQYWRLVMPMFLHIGILHLLMDMYALYLLGPLLERIYGYGRYSLIYVLAGIGSSYLSMTRSNDIAAGASGAIFGIAGAMLVTGYLHPAVVPPRWKRVFGKGILILIVLNFAITLPIKWIDNWGHLGGLATGIVLALLIPPPASGLAAGYAQEDKPSQSMVVIPIALVVLAMAATYQYYASARAITAMLTQAKRLEAAQQNAPARQLLEQAARQAPGDERPREALGELDLAEKKIPGAIREYQQALRLDPQSLEAPFGLAQAYQAAGNGVQAAAVLKQAQSQFPQDAEGQYLFASLAVEHKLYAEAIVHYQQALRLKPDMAEALNDLAWLYATCDDTQYRHPHQALALAQRAVALTRWKQPDFIDTLAEAFYANGQYQQAVATQKKALALSPGNRELQEHMARYQKAAGT